MLDVRNGAVSRRTALYGDATPNRDRLTVEEQRAAYEALNRRWLR